MSKKSGVMARDMKTKEQSEILNAKLYYRLTTTGKKRYRLAGVSAAGTKMSAFVSEDVAAKFGNGTLEQPKERKARKSCEEKFDECKAKRPGRKPAADKAPAKRGRAKKEEAATEEVEGKVEEAVEVSEKAVKKMKQTKKKATPKVEKAAEELAEAAEGLAEAVAEAPKKKAPAKKAPAKKTGGKKAPAKKTAGKKAPAKKTGGKK
jgi:hypothetical protein